MKSPSPDLTEVVIVQPKDAAGVRLRTALISTPSVEIIEELTDASTAVEAVSQLCPDVVVLRVELQDVRENGVLAALRDIAPRARIVLHAVVASVVAPGRKRWIGRLISLIVGTDGAARLEARLELDDDPGSVPLARALLTQLLGQWEMEDLVDLAALVMTELVSNAIRHAPGACALELTRRDDALSMAVVDSGTGLPDLHLPGISASGGRGLHIVAALSDEWGIDRRNDGTKVVWAELRTPLDASDPA